MPCGSDVTGTNNYLNTITPSFCTICKPNLIDSPLICAGSLAWKNTFKTNNDEDDDDCILI